MLSTRGFVPETLLEIIRNNLVVDVSRGMEVVEAGMTRSMRKRLRQAKARGCIVREASRSDLPRFFELMSATCRRQGERSPNPESVTQLAALWEAFQPSGRLRITLCEIGGRAVAGLLCLRWGGRMTLWKKGWDETHGDARPNEILYGESFEWAIGQGIKSCDFGALNPTDAGRLLSGQALCDDSHRGRDYFNLSFGGSAVRLPEAMIWFDRPWWRWGYAAAGWLAQVRRFLRTGTLASPAHSKSTESVQAVGSSPN
jgi:hypothetical protein